MITNPLPKFYSCPKKYQARFKTIIEMYRHYFGYKIPQNRQYWTMCGLNADDKGNLQSKSELGQMIENSLITPKQFYGVDIDENTIILNKTAIKDANWFNEDFITQMKMANKESKFRPSLINADLLSLPYRGTQKIAEIMSFVTDCQIKNVMLIGNIMLTNPHSLGHISIEEAKKRAEKIPLILSKSIAFKYAWNSQKWRMHDQYYLYKGTGNGSKTYLATFIFVKERL